MKTILRTIIALSVCVAINAASDARIGLVTLPKRDAVQLTIYNSADLTLVRERRKLTLAKGVNKLEFSWANTLIDPTSVQFDALTNADKVELVDISFPAEAPNALVWTVQSELNGEVLVEISYFTSGLSWKADYEAVLEKDGKKMRLNSYVKASNGSGENYEGAQVRLVVGTIHLVENIADLANRGGRPIPAPVLRRARELMMYAQVPEVLASRGAGKGVEFDEEIAPPEIIREGLSEYFIYTVSGEHEVPDKWSVRWQNFVQDNIGVENFYRYEEGRYNSPQRFLKLKNDEAHNLGKEPLPDGRIEVFKLRENGTRIFLGRTQSKYIPKGEEWEIDLGSDPDVVVKPILLRRDVDNIQFDSRGNPDGWDVIESWKLEVLNSRLDAVTIEIDRNFDGDFVLSKNAEKEKYDFDTIRYRRNLTPKSSQDIEYTITYKKGTRSSIDG